MCAGRELVIGCVGKPSAGKSTFLNAATDAKAKIGKMEIIKKLEIDHHQKGNYPFTTIDPNHGVAHYQVDCPCAKYGKSDLCGPRYGRCMKGTRFVPIKVLDVAGLVPGASEGAGLGNRFLDDLRHADVLLHVIDVSGTTNEKGENTKGYNPINDIEWLTGEIRAWVFNNLWKKWGSIVRRHTATKSSAVSTLHLQFSGYGTRAGQVQEMLDRMGVKEPSEMEKWDEAKVRQLVNVFVDVRFPTIYVLNKIDCPEADANIMKICEKYGEERVVLSSALSECFLRKMENARYVRYKTGDSDFVTAEDEKSSPPSEPVDQQLMEPDLKCQRQLEKIRDLVLFRYGSTGVQLAITRAVHTMGYIPAYPVKNIHNFSSTSKSGKQATVFRDCILVPPNTTVREFARMAHPDLEKYFAYAEGVSGTRMGEDEIVTEENNIIRIVTLPREEDDHKPKNKGGDEKNKDKSKENKKPKEKGEKAPKTGKGK